MKVFNLSLKLKCWQLQSPAETHENTNNIRSAHAHILPQSFQGKTDIEAEKFSTKHFQFEFEGSKGALSCWRLNCVNKKNLLISFLLVPPDATGSRSIGVSRKIPSVEIQTFFLWRKCSENQLSFATLKHRKKTDAEEKIFQLKEEKFVCSCDKTRRWQARIFRKPLVSCL